MKSLVVLDFHAHAYTPESLLSEPTGGTESAVIETLLALSELMEVVLYNAVPQEQRLGNLVLKPAQRGVHTQDLKRADWVLLVSTVNAELLKTLSRLGSDLRLGLWAHHDIDQKQVAALADSTLRAMFSHYLFVSEWQQERYIDHFQIDPTLASVIGNPYVARAFKAPPSKLCDVPRLIYCSTPFRGLDVAAAAFVRFRQSHPDASFTVFSGMEIYGSKDNSSFLPLFSQLQATPGIHFRSPVGKSELYRALQASNLLLYPATFEETFCIAALEAAIHQNALVLTPTGGLYENFSFAEFVDARLDQALDFDTLVTRTEQALQRAWIGASSPQGQVQIALASRYLANRYHPKEVAKRLHRALLRN